MRSDFTCKVTKNLLLLRPKCEWQVLASPFLLGHSCVLEMCYNIRSEVKAVPRLDQTIFMIPAVMPSLTQNMCLKRSTIFIFYINHTGDDIARIGTPYQQLPLLSMSACMTFSRGRLSGKQTLKGGTALGNCVVYDKLSGVP